MLICQGFLNGISGSMLTTPQLKNYDYAKITPRRILSRGIMMSIYLMLTTLTDEGRKTIKENPDRIKEVNKEVELMGVKILSQYALLGQYDFINIIEAPSDEIAAKLAINLSARGTVQANTMPAMAVDTLIETLKKKPESTPW